MKSILDALRQEHRNITRLLDAVDHQVAFLARAAAPDYEVLQAIAEYFCDYPDRCHHPKENAVFARLSEKCPDEAASIGDLLQEHRDTAARAQAFRETIDSLFRDAVVPRAALVKSARDFVEAERRHMRMEEERFFPLALRKLTAEDWNEVAAQLSQERDPLFGDHVEENFAALRERLLAWETEYHPA